MSRNTTEAVKGSMEKVMWSFDKPSDDTGMGRFPSTMIQNLLLAKDDSIFWRKMQHITEHIIGVKLTTIMAAKVFKKCVGMASVSLCACCFS